MNLYYCQNDSGFYLHYDTIYDEYIFNKEKYSSYQELILVLFTKEEAYNYLKNIDNRIHIFPLFEDYIPHHNFFRKR